MRWRAAELQSDSQRPRQRHPPSASLGGRGKGGVGEGGVGEGGVGEGGVGEGGVGEGGGREGGRGGVLPKRLKSGSGHHRLELCGPSNGRHKLA